jgi:hypothetical protein
MRNLSFEQQRYTSMADTDEVIDEALEKFEAVLSNVEGV